MMLLGLAQRSHRHPSTHTKQVVRHRIKNWDETLQSSHRGTKLLLQEVSSNSVCVAEALDVYKMVCDKTKPINMEWKDKR